MGTQSKPLLLSRDVCCVLGLPFDITSLRDTVNEVNLLAETGQPCFLSTPNLNFVIATQSDSNFFQSVVDSDLSVADGMPLIWVAKLLGLPLPERVAGSTLFDDLSKQQGKPNKIKVFFFGGEQGIAEQAHNKLNETSSAMVSCGFYDPGFVAVDEMSTSDVIDHINTAAPDFVVVALGAKKGQAWIQNNRDKLTVPIISHLGAVINFVAGNIERAPVFWQRSGLEWLWRVKQEPTLWRRYLFDGLAFIKLLLVKVFPLAVYDRTLKRSSFFQNSCEIKLENTDNNIIHLGGSIHHKNLTELKQSFSSVIEQFQGDVEIDCAKLEYIDAAFIATLLLFQRYLNEQNRQLSLQAVPKRIIRILSFNIVLTRFIIIP